MVCIDLEAIVSTGIPVLCMDTCSLLDIVRDPRRHDMRVDDKKATFDLLDAVEHGHLAILIAETVKNEFDFHRPKIMEDAKKALLDFKIYAQRVNHIVALFGSSGQIDLGHFDGHVDRSGEILDRWIASALKVSPAKEVKNRALKRVNLGIAPAQKGKNSYGDCEIIETYFDIVKRLRAAGLKSNIVFVSSNTKDFAEIDKINLKHDLTIDFNSRDMKYAPNMFIAKHLLGFQ